MKLTSVIKRSTPQVFKTKLKQFLGDVPAAEHDYRMEIGQFGGFAVAYRSPTTDKNVINDSFEDDHFFPAVPQYTPASDHVILDVGAHIGTFALLASQKSPKGVVYAIEACRETFNYLTVNIALNCVENIRPFHLALSDRAGHAKLSYSEGIWGNSIMAARTAEGETVHTQSLAGFMEENGISHVDFAKFNCEGAEFPILLSASRDVLQRFRWMLVLYHCDLAVGYQNEQLEQHLRNAGFSTSVCNKSAKRGWIVAKNEQESRSAL